MKERHKAIIATYLILQKEEKMLFLQRNNTGYCDGLYGLPSGHTEEGEPLITTMIRETKEEIGIILTASDLTLVHVRDRKANDGHRIDFFFTCRQWQGEIINNEPHKCSDMIWSDPEIQPNIIPYITEVFAAIKKGEHYSLENW